MRDDIIIKKDLPIVASVCLNNFVLSGTEAIELLSNHFKERGYCVHSNEYIKTDEKYVTWNYSGFHEIVIWTTYENHNDSVNVDDYFSIPENSKLRVKFNLIKYNL